MEKLRVKHFALSLVSMLVFSLALAACGPAAPTPEMPTDEPMSATPTQEGEVGVVDEPSGGYPAPSDAQSEEGYPPPSPTAPVAEGSYPPPTRISPTAVTSYPAADATREDGIDFAFERPISAGDTVIRGVGPAGLQVSIINVTFMGEEIATTQVDADGQFEVEVPALEAGLRLGLTADIEGTDLEQQIVPGEGALNVPQVGYFFDSIVITGDS